MGSLYISDKPRQGEYKESVGLDIDGEIIGEAPNDKNYYDYDLLNRPTFDRVGTNILIVGFGLLIKNIKTLRNQ